MQYLKKHVQIIIIMLAFTSCKNNSNDKEAAFIADMETPMGHNSLKIYKDKTFIFEHRRLLKNTIYTGKVIVNKDTLSFDYEGLAPDFGDIAVIDGIFLTYTNGVYNELLEISLDKLSE